MNIQRPRGTRDFLPDDTWKRGQVRKAMKDVLERWGYQEIATPTFEHLELFTIKSGESVTEEIYSFKDKGGRDIALRPELTAPVMRMYVSELQNAPKPQRLYYYGSCFMYERPQRGRFREFWQLGAELIGGNKTDSEAEVIALADQMLMSVGIEADIHIGHLGLIRSMLSKVPQEQRAAIMRMIDKKERENLQAYLKDIGADHLGLLELIELKGRFALDRAVELSHDLVKSIDASSSRDDKASTIIKSPMAASKSGRESARTGREVAAELGLEEFQKMVDLLEVYGVDATIDFEIVRGLEYYSGTVFEIYASGLGSQKQICGGGTYELCSLFGGSETSSTGFGLCFDRIMEIVQLDTKRKSPAVLVFTPDVKQEAVKIAKELRKAVPLVLDVMGRSFGAQLKAAAGSGAKHVVIVGRNELDSGKLTLRDMKSGEQESLTLGEIAERLAGKYSFT
ncbi:Histidine--tRNA ligase [uncultured archaeon]|nr:Histidine--tRNA ligase [uncultured archaeon]